MEKEIAAAILGAAITAIPTTAVAIAAAVISRNQARVERQQAELASQRYQLDLFKEFNSRFDRLNEDLNAIWSDTALDNPKRNKEAVAQDYLNLCSEEYLWYKNKLISQEIWDAWYDGIVHYINRDGIIAEVFLREKIKAPNSYYGIFQVLPLLPH
ncbi:hypothetical protein [Hymenobacter sp. BT559]|uniref:hypothetical protein n=1 Tax=Hymenobacter sp. BT559 TaxID=2795729 RepID=UPI0018EE4499|nr:hypothetical protein [Hymenobacter sp. BT559]MBJ6146333.1 hypothetical protein [Hymenobacter sp. BT559]